MCLLSFFRLLSFQFYFKFRFVSLLPFSSFIYLIITLLLLPHFFVSCYFTYVLFRHLLNYTCTSPPGPLLLGIVPRYYIPPSCFQCHLQFQCSSFLIPFLFFPVLHSTLLCSFFFHVAVLPCSSAVPRILPSPNFVLHFYIYYHFGLIFTYLLFVPVF